jgi:hypothetical protein
VSSAVHHPVFARLYARMAASIEEHGAAAQRRELLAGLTGRVIGVGAGTGANFAHYPATVAEVVAVEREASGRAAGCTSGSTDTSVPQPTSPQILGIALRPWHGVGRAGWVGEAPCRSTA